MGHPSFAKLGVLLVLAMLFVQFIPSSGVRAQEAETWTVMVYMSGDSSLSSQIPQDIQEMKAVGSGEGLDILVLMDSGSVGDSSLVRILPDGEETIPLTDVNSTWGDELNMGQASVLVDFVTWAAASYPADRYMLDLWGHGSGWPGVCPDKGNYLDAVELGTAMSSVKDAGINIDIVSMDACQMGSLEIAYELRDTADYALLSQKDVPLSGWPYDAFLGHLKGIGTVEEKAAAMADSYIEWGTVHSLYSVTLSLIDLREIGAIAAPIRFYVAALASMAGYFNPQFIDARTATEEYDGDSQYDLIHLLGNIDGMTGCRYLEELSDGITGRLVGCIAYERHWTNAVDEPADNAHGLSLWFPAHSAGVDYLATDFANDTGWPGFLSVMSGYFRQPGRVETAYAASAVPADTDGDGLHDSIDLSFGSPGNGSVEITVYGPDGNLTVASVLPSGGNMTESLDDVGYYQVEFLLWDSQGNLANRTLFDKGLAKESLRSISGTVTSDTGRGMGWVGVNLLDGDGKLVASSVTDRYGQYSMEVVVPTQTGGTGLVLECGLGADRVNATINALNATNEFDFIIEMGGEYVAWLVAGAGIMNIAAIILLVYWAVLGRKRVVPGGRQPPTENLIEQQPIPPQ